MGKAKVNISDVAKLNTGAVGEKTAANALKSAILHIDSLANKAESEKTQLEECVKNCDIALQTGEKKKNHLQKQLSELNSKLAVTPPTITVSKPCGTDEEGNTEYVDVEIPNPEYQALLEQIAETERRIAAIESLISQLHVKRQQLSKAIALFQEAISNLRKSKQEINLSCETISKKSDIASSQLKKALAAIRKYLDETVHTNPVPSHTTIAWDNSSPFIRTEPNERNNHSNSSYSDNSGNTLYTPKWKRSSVPNDRSVDLKTINPNYNKDEKWQINCQRCVPTYEMQKRGYNVTARPKPGGKDHLSYYPFDVWENPSIKRSYNSGFDEIKQNMVQWGDGARAQIVVVWRGTNSGHTFIAEQRNGQTCFLDPQTGESNVSYYFDDVKPGATRFCRIDNLDTSRYIKECCKEI